MHVRVRTLIDAPRAAVSALYADYQRWPEIFPLIVGVRLLRRDETKLVIEVHHREGLVINELAVGPADRIELVEWKRRYDARFVNRFVDTPRGTLLTVDGDIDLKGWARVLGPLLAPVARRRMKRWQLQPLKLAAEGRARRDR
jgi:hypothetical protein